MTCEDCEIYQQEGKVGYFRVHKANVQVSGCPKHLAAMFDTLRNHMEELTERAKE